MTGTQGQQLRLETCRMLEDWARKQDYGFRNLYPGNHEPYRNRLSESVGPYPDTFDYPLTYLLVEGSGAYDQLIDEIEDLLPAHSSSSPSAQFRIEVMRWIDEEQEWPLAPESQEMTLFRMPWEPTHMSRTEMAVQLTYWPEKSITVSCCESRHISRNRETARHMLRSVLYGGIQPSSP
ncbi:MAG: hypothetical protein HUU01_10500 [Saprospiraceae bacterium]|nr:hypothetical protein [Saprospiraceae bacterium]